MKGMKRFFGTPCKAVITVICIIAAIALVTVIFVSARVFAGKKSAQSIVFADAGIAPSDAGFVRTGVEFDRWQLMYEIDFISGSTEYEYLIKASDGTIVKKETDSLNAKAENEKNSAITTLEEAKAIALQDAGLAASDVTFTKTKRDKDDGADVYEIEFYTQSHEYEYEINTETGAVRSMDIDALTRRK